MIDLEQLARILPATGATVTGTALFAHFIAFSSRLPSDSSRSSRSPAKTISARPAATSDSDGLRIELFHTRTMRCDQRRHRRAVDDAVALRGDARALQIMVDLLLHGVGLVGDQLALGAAERARPR